MAHSAGSIVCPACGAGVSKAAAKCPYCGAEVVLPKPRGADGPTDRKTYCTRCGTLYGSHAGRCSRCPPPATDEKGGRCPRCTGLLDPVPMGTIVADRCGACGGHWFDGDEVEHAIDLTTKGITRDEARAMRGALPEWKQPVEEIRYLACVRCGERMSRRMVAARVGVIVDICRPHGVWFDGGEFEHFASVAKAGAIEVLRFDATAAAAARPKAPTVEHDPVWVGSPPLGGSLGHDVLRALGRLFRHAL
jgi:Zn-finger nucleic acid-binding protein